jgi:TRAP-type C4-dicarboxylate transport system substrate-binding protein
MLRSIVGLVAGIAILGVASNAEAGTTLKIGTVAPPGSSWAKQFEKMAKDVKDATNGDVELQFVYSQADEPGIVSKTQGGAELQGGAVTAAGLAKIYPDVLGFQMPGLWGDDVDAGWSKLEKARGRLRGELDSAFQGAGVRILGWGDVGVARIMGTKAVTNPGDLNGLKTFKLNGDTIAPTLSTTLGLSADRSMTVGEVAFQVKNFDVFAAPPLAAVNLGWTANVTHINTMPVAFLIGAIVINSKSFEALPQATQDLLKTNGDTAGASLTKSIRKADKAAFATIKTKCGTDGTHEGDKDAWRKKFKEIRDALVSQNVISRDFYNKLTK